MERDKSKYIISEGTILMKKNILVTGGAGFIGSHLVDKLVALGHFVRVLDNLDPQVHGSLKKDRDWPDYCNAQAEYVHGDVCDRGIFVNTLRDIDVVYHLAAVVGVGQSMYEVQRYVEVNVGGTAVLLDILANQPDIRQRLQRIIVASSMSNYGEGEYACPVHGRVSPRLRDIRQLRKHQWDLYCSEPSKENSITLCNRQLHPIPTRESKPLQATSTYAITKKTQEELCLAIGEAYHIPVVALRFFNTYGTRQALSNPYTGVAAIFSGRLLNNNPPLIFEDGRQVRDFIHVSDLVQAIVLAMGENFPAGIYNVGSGLPISIEEVARSLAKYLGKNIEPIISNQFRAGDIRHCYADISKIKKQGFKPQVTWEKGISDLTEWVKKQQAEDSFETVTASLQEKGLTF